MLAPAAGLVVRAGSNVTASKLLPDIVYEADKTVLKRRILYAVAVRE